MLRFLESRGTQPAMEQFFEFAGNHPFLAGGTAIVLVLVIVNELRLKGQAGTSLSPNDAIRLINQGARVLDVRNAEQFAQGHLQGARHVSADAMGETVEKLKKNTSKPVLTYCDTGTVSARATAVLRGAGFDHAFSLRGGLTEWKRENLPLSQD